jgi:hypothetical protein
MTAQMTEFEGEVPIDVIESVTIVDMIHLCERKFQHVSEINLFLTKTLFW